MRHVQTELDDKTFLRLKEAAIMQRKSLKNLLREIIELFLATIQPPSL